MGIIMMETNGVILLAGGASLRMGQDKWMLRVGESTLLERIITALHPLAAELWVIGANTGELVDSNKFPALSFQSFQSPHIQTTHDIIANIGPLGGIASGLTHCTQEYILVTATDMPFPSIELAKALFTQCQTTHNQAVVPEQNGRLHPLFAVYRKDCLPSLIAYIEGGGRKVMEWLHTLDITVLTEKQIEKLDPRGSALFNMNHREDYALALKLLQDKNHLQN
jgi:molybdopterin-guanine dinucleotide biosynthesis protein A